MADKSFWRGRWWNMARVGAYVNYTIRRATQDDKNDIRVLIDAFVRETEHYPLAAQPSDVDSYYEYARTGISNGDPVLLALDNFTGKTVGLLLWIDTKFVYYDERVPPKSIAALGTYVIPAYRGHRIAAQLRDKGCEIMRERGYERAIGTIQEGNLAGRRSLEKRGWKTAYSVIVKELS